MNRPNIVLAITGASGSAYAIRLAQILLGAGYHIHVIVSGAARQVAMQELDVTMPSDDAPTSEWLQFTRTALATGTAERWGFRDWSTDFTGTFSVHGIGDYSAG
ncbi:MAG: hypothetical protein GY826_43915, partial [Fuerstiella sp.]|nr:hypothetical protein [Fuerstiella sp.]